MVLTMGDHYYRQRAAASGRRVRRESDARRDLERMHLMTIKREKMRLQEELDRVRVKGGIKNAGVTNASKNAKLLSSRFVTTANGEGANQRRSRLRTSTASSPQRTTSPMILRRNTTNTSLGSSMSSAMGASVTSERELPQIGFMPTPLTGELDSRRQKDEMRNPQTKINELKKNEGQATKLLSLKVDMFTRSLTPVSQTRSPARSPVQSPTPKSDERFDEADVTMSDYVFSPRKQDSDRYSRSSFPPANIKKNGHFDPSQDNRGGINARLVPLDIETNGSDHGLPQNNDILPKLSSTKMISTQLPPRPTIIRRQSQVAILERNDKKKNKYAITKDTNGNTTSNTTDKVGEKKNVESELNLAVLGRDAKRVKEIIENPEIVFDQEKYAPDGALRTVHMLPNAEDSFSQAREARYLRWRDPRELDRERELTVSEIFAKGSSAY